MWVDTYQPQAIKPNIVEKEGIYQLKIMNTSTGVIQPKTPSESLKRYFQVECIINAPGNPKISIFLTEGPKFDGTATAFFDTFGIMRNNFDSQSWNGKVGFMKIELKQKGEYLNMVPTYILDENGFVQKPNLQQHSAPEAPAPSGSVDQYGYIPF